MDEQCQGAPLCVINDGDKARQEDHSCVGCGAFVHVPTTGGVRCWCLGVLGHIAAVDEEHVLSSAEEYARAEDVRE